MEKIEEFVKIIKKENSGYGDASTYGYGDGDGSGSGYGSGDGSGSGYGSGSGSAYGDGYGYGYGSGYGYGYGSGNGSGSGSGYGYGYGSGYASGDGYESLKSLNNYIVYKIDHIPTIITHLRNNIAKGFIVNKDLTLTPCYVVKQNNLFAHGETLKKAMIDLSNKLFQSMNEEERVKEFWKIFKPQTKYPAMLFFEWHNKLTGSCEIGRRSFVKDKNVDLEKDKFTVEEFVEICKDSYGGEIIKSLLVGSKY